VRSMTAACELLRLRCGGVRCTHALRVSAADDFAFAFHQADQIHFYRSVFSNI